MDEQYQDFPDKIKCRSILDNLCDLRVFLQLLQFSTFSDKLQTTLPYQTTNNIFIQLITFSEKLQHFCLHFHIPHNNNFQTANNILRQIT